MDKKQASVYVNQNLYTKTNKTDKFLSITKQWHNNDLIELVLPIGLTFVTLPDDNTIGAFRYGSEVLAGLTEQERVLFIKDNDVCQELSADTERNGEILEHFIKQKIKTQVLIL